MKSAFIFNPESGKKSIKKHLKFVLSKLEEKFGTIECLETKYKGHAFDIAKFRGEEFDYLFVSGGDGTLDEIINGIGDLKRKPTIGYIPSGTVNDFSKSVGISHNWKKALSVILNGKVFEHDIFSVNNYYGLYVCCAGIFTDTSYSTKRVYKKFFGKLAYFNYGIKEMFNAKAIKVKLEINDEEIETLSSLVMILNSKSLAGFKLNKNAVLDDGEVDVVIFKTNTDKVYLKDIKNVAKAFVNGIDGVKNKDFVIYRKASSLKISLDESVNINLDGEKRENGSFVLSVLPRSVRFIVPQKFKGGNYAQV